MKSIKIYLTRPLFNSNISFMNKGTKDTNSNVFRYELYSELQLTILVELFTGNLDVLCQEWFYLNRLKYISDMIL